MVIGRELRWKKIIYLQSIQGRWLPFETWTTFLKLKNMTTLSTNTRYQSLAFRGRGGLYLRHRSRHNGNGIAHVFAQAVFCCIAVDVSATQLEKAWQPLKNLDRQLSKGSITEEQKKATP